jgi:cobalt-precorrin-5B (C1)-methyltransferase
MLDPVSGFEYPEAWVRKCRSPDRLALVEEGLAVLTSSGTVLVRGFTTGTTAAAVSKAAVLSLSGEMQSVPVRIPCGLVVDVPVDAHGGRASGRKFGGDYPSDVTAGIEFVAEAVPYSHGVHLVFGDGIGRFSRDTPRYKKGTPAVSPPALECLQSAVREARESSGLSGVRVTLHIPEGQDIAKQTLNPRVGVEGGISVLGTTGLVEPWDDHLTESVAERVAAADHPVLTTGRVGLRYARLLFPDRDVILIGGKIGEALAAARGKVVLCGLPALILRYIRPGILDGTGAATVEELAATPGFGAIVEETLAEFRQIHPAVRVILVNRNGTVIGESP